MGVDLFIEDRNLTLPDRICRELFQIYRESLHNVKKHANASHVVVKLGQDEAKVVLVIDDNGRGFSFLGDTQAKSLIGCVSARFRLKNEQEASGERLRWSRIPGTEHA